MSAKLGLPKAPASAATKALIEDILKLMATDKVDYTIFWRRLSHGVASQQFDQARDMFINREAFDAWLLSLQEHSAQIPCRIDTDLMLKTNPTYVLRNHLGEQAIRAAKLKDFSELERLQTLLQSPFTEVKGMQQYATFPPDWASTIEISCSS